MSRKVNSSKAVTDQIRDEDIAGEGKRTRGGTPLPARLGPKRLHTTRTPEPKYQVTFPTSAMDKLKDLKMRQTAERLFVYEGYEVQEIADMYRRSLPDVVQWGLEDRWEQKREAENCSTDRAADVLENRLMEYIMSIKNNNNDLTEHAARLILTTSKAVAALRADKQTLRGIMFAMLKFIEYLKAADPEILGKIEPHINTFLEQRRKQAGV